MARRRGQKWNPKALTKTIGSFVRSVFQFLPTAFAAGLVVFTFFGVKQMLYADPYFRITRVTVFPSGILTDAEYQYLQDQSRNRSLLELDLKLISKNLERNPKVKRAEVMRVLPNQLKVFLATRSPILQIRLSERGAYYLVGSDQMVLAARDMADPDLMILEDFSTAQKSYSAGALYANRYFGAVTEVLVWLQNDPWLSREVIAKMRLDRLGNIAFVFSDGIELRIGRTPIHSPSKIALLKTLLESGERNQILYVDLRFQDVIVKRKTL